MGDQSGISGLMQEIKVAIREICISTQFSVLYISLEDSMLFINFQNQPKLWWVSPGFCLPGKLSTNARRYRERLKGSFTFNHA